MARWPHPHDEDPDQNLDSNWDLGEGLDPDGPSAADLDRFGDELDPCPACGNPVYDQMAICPSCGHVLEDQPKSVSLWAVFGVVGLIVLLLIFVF